MITAVLTHAVTFAVGFWAGRQYAKASGQVDAVIAHTHARLDAEHEYRQYCADRQSWMAALATAEPWKAP